METPRFSETVHTLSDHVRDYIDMRIDLIKLILVEKMSRLTSLLLLLILLFMVLLFAGVFAALAFVLWYGESIGPMWVGALIVVGIALLKGIIIYLFRKKFLLNPIITQLSKIIMEEPSYEQPE